MALRAVLFDFDGTLVDTRTASWPLFAETNRHFALGIDTREQFFALFEGNLFEALAQHCHDEARGKAAGQHFMDLVRSHYDPPLIDGIATLLHSLAAELPLAIVSSNMSDTIARLLQRDGLQNCFTIILGGDAYPSKTTAIAAFLGMTTSTDPLTPAEVVLVTDTVGDVGEARASGIRAYGVSWGMHKPPQLMAAGAEGVADNAAQLLHWLQTNRAMNKMNKERQTCRV